MRGDYEPWRDKWNWLYLIPLVLSVLSLIISILAIN